MDPVLSLDEQCSPENVCNNVKSHVFVDFQNNAETRFKRIFEHC